MQIYIGNKKIGGNNPVLIVAELSANHNQKYDRAIETIKAMKDAGADAVKLQTYTPDTLTIDSQNEMFLKKDGLWKGKILYELYKEAYTPWEWQPKLKKIANDLGMELFSTPFDHTAVDFLEKMDVPAYKVASFELVDIPLLRKIAQTGKPIILSTGMASLAEIDEAVSAIREEGGNQLALLKCTSAYPAPPEEMNLRTIPHLAEAFSVPTGLSDHTLGIAVPVAAVAIGACIVEKHFTLSRSIPTPDSAFSLEPDEFKQMVESIRTAERAVGKVCYELTEKQKESIAFRRSIFVVKDINAGEAFTEENIKSIRPGYGLLPKYFDEVIGKKATQDVIRGTPLRWDLIKEE